LEAREARGAWSDLGVTQTMLGKLLMRDPARLPEALSLTEQALGSFERANEAGRRQATYYQIGQIRLRLGRFEDAEEPLLHSLRLAVEAGDEQAEANATSALGALLLEHLPGRAAEAVSRFRRAVALLEPLGEPRRTAEARSNLGAALVRDGQLVEARAQLERALAEKGGGDDLFAEPWRTHVGFQELARAEGRPAEAREAWMNARNAWARARLEGIVQATESSRPCAHTWIVLTQQPERLEELRSALWELRDDEDMPEPERLLGEILLEVVAGRYEPDLGDDPRLSYTDAAELRFVLQSLSAPPDSE
ncbi:MAG: tetratricopeptide repeat protein, partial [Myxococcota bacterium]